MITPPAADPTAIPGETVLPGPPEGFAAYWDRIDAELAHYPAAAEVTAVPLRSTPFSTTHEVRLTSIGPYRIFAWLSVPHGEGPFPGLLHTPRYGSVVTPPHYDQRERYVVLSLVHRGQRLADEPFAAAYPGLLTMGIDDPARYIFRAIAADVLRGAEVLLGHPSVDRSRVGIMGNDLAIITAARRPGFTALHLTDTLFYRLDETRHRTEAYPVEEINDHLRQWPERAEAVAATLSHFEPRHHGPAVRATTLLPTGDPGTLSGTEWLAPLRDALGGPVEPYAVTHEGGTDHDATDAWMAARLGVEARPRVWATG
ncbi:MAG: acetylxylan esterase [Thermomicrobiales bacterium]